MREIEDHLATAALSITFMAWKKHEKKKNTDFIIFSSYFHPFSSIFTHLRSLLGHLSLSFSCEARHEGHARDVKTSGGHVRGDQDAFLPLMGILRNGTSKSQPRVGLDAFFFFFN